MDKGLSSAHQLAVHAKKRARHLLCLPSPKNRSRLVLRRYHQYPIGIVEMSQPDLNPTVNWGMGEWWTVRLVASLG